MALIFENCGKLEKALSFWQELKTEEGCMKTVGILRKKEITSKDLVWKYMPWVLETKPEVGLSLFIQRKTESSKEGSKNSMSNSS